MTEKNWNFAMAMIGLFVLGTIMIYPVDQHGLYDKIEQRGDFANWYSADCKQINSDINAAGGVLPYYINRQQEHRNWQYEYRNGNNQSPRQPIFKKRKSYEDNWNDWQARR